MNLQPQHTSTLQKAARIILGTFMFIVGIGHLTFQRKAFQAQVPDWVPAEKHFTVLSSGVELAQEHLHQKFSR